MKWVMSVDQAVAGDVTVVADKQRSGAWAPAL